MLPCGTVGKWHYHPNPLPEPAGPLPPPLTWFILLRTCWLPKHLSGAAPEGAVGAELEGGVLRRSALWGEGGRGREGGGVAAGCRSSTVKY
jgi:hypothetical protein